VLAARIPNLEWIVVEDNFEVSSSTRAIIEKALDSGISARAIFAEVRHRSRAGNAGIAVATGKYLHFHDDDDTVHPDFFIRTIDFLEKDDRYVGVRTMCDRVQEKKNSNGGYSEIRRRRHYPERRTVSLADLSILFTCPPIGTVFRRQVIDCVGGLDDNLAVSEDYDLLLRVLLQGDIGTIRESLANVHSRPVAALNSPEANSAISRNFEEEDALFRNHLLRRDIAAGKIGLGWLLTFGRIKRLNGIDYLINRLRHVTSFGR
jgi:hypothetical protein